MQFWMLARGKLSRYTKMTFVKKFIDIGANLTDDMYRGFYHGSQKHQPDLDKVLERAYNNGVDKLIITGTDLESSKTAIEMANSDDRLYATVGCHPTRCNEFDECGDPGLYLQRLKDMIINNFSKVVAIGECGLDYDRLHFCGKETQQKYFEQQLIMCQELKLPLFLHCRNAFEDFIRIIENQNYKHQGVVHSFDGTAETMKLLIELGFSIGINGCSLKTESNLEVLKLIPRDKLLIESDCPWCEIRPSHAGYKYVKTRIDSVKKEKWKNGFLVKGRNEPCNIIQVSEIMSEVREEHLDELSQQMYENTMKLFRKIE